MGPFFGRGPSAFKDGLGSPLSSHGTAGRLDPYNTTAGRDFEEHLRE